MFLLSCIFHPSIWRDSIVVVVLFDSCVIKSRARIIWRISVWNWLDSLIFLSWLWEMTIHWVKYFINYSSNRKRWRLPCHHFLHITYWHQCQQIHLPYFQQSPPFALMEILFISPPLTSRTKGWMTSPEFYHSVLSFHISGEKYNQLPLTMYFLSNQLKNTSSFIS